MSTHSAVVTVAVCTPLEILQVPTITPTDGYVRVRNQWTASSPVDLHQSDGGNQAMHPQGLGTNTAGTVVEVGPCVRCLKIGDKSFGFTWRERKEKAHQEYVTTPEYLLGKIPQGFTFQEAASLPDNFITVFHAVTANFGFLLPWPRPENYHVPHAEDPILI